MKFLFPGFLIALLSVAVPVFIHLFSFRRYKTVYFSNVDFLKEIKRETQKRSRLKQLIILSMRILALVFLVLAFAQPYIPGRQNQKNQKEPFVTIYIDNSFSMNALSEKGQLLEVARNKAHEICMTYPPEARFSLVTNDPDPLRNRVVNREQFVQEIARVEISHTSAPLSAIYNRIANNTKQSDNQSTTLFVISDFQNSITDPENFIKDSLNCYFLPLKANPMTNLYIDSCWTEVPAHRTDQEENIFVRIKNCSDQDFQNLPINLYLHDSLKSITNFSVNAGSDVIANLKFYNHSTGFQPGRIEITDYPFTHDNTWYISYMVEPELNILAVYENTASSLDGLTYIKALFQDDNYMNLDIVPVQNLQVSRLRDYNTIFLIQSGSFSSGLLNELRKAAESGVSVVLFPETDLNSDTYSQFRLTFGLDRLKGIDTTTLKISGINLDHIFFRDVFKKREENPVLPEIHKHFVSTQQPITNETVLLWFPNGDAALSTLPFGMGNIWNFSFPLNRRNESFARDVLFVPVMYNIVLNSSVKQQMSLTIGKDIWFDLPGFIRPDLNYSLEMEEKNSGNKFIPDKLITDQGIRLNVGNQIVDAGHYRLINHSDTLAVAAFNYARNESDLNYLSPGELKDKIQSASLDNVFVIDNPELEFSGVFKEISQGKQLWMYCIILSLVFILAEVFVIRYWK